jgi:ubiquinone/menaquinone biosynthesis C-methylase UbiE
MSGSTETFQITMEQAEMYEATFVPAIFADWAPPLVDAAGIQPGQSVLDVACGTGIVARTAAACVGSTGRVVGLDLNEAMLGVARRVRPDIEWQQGDAASLPFPDGTFDVTLRQSALMSSRIRSALSEMRRVTRSPGIVAVQVYDRLDSQPGYRPFIEVAVLHAGAEATSLLGTYWVHGDLDALARLFEAASLQIVDTRTRVGILRFGSIDEFVRTEIYSTPLAGRISEATIQQILDGARDALAPFGTPDGRVEIPIQGHIVTAKP